MFMKKNVFTLLTVIAAVTLLCSSTAIFAAGGDSTRTYPMEENFESGTFPPTGWNVYDVDGLGMNWEADEIQNHTPGGSFSAYHGFASGIQDGWMVTPAMNLPGSGPIVLAFWNFTVDPSYYGKNSVLISTGSGDPADGDFVEIWTTSTVAAEWQQVVLSLVDYAGQTAYMAFRYEGDFAHGWAVDDVYIGSDFNTLPQIIVNPTVVNATVPVNSTINKTLTVLNAGVENLIYTIDFEYNGAIEGWLSIDPLTGNIGASANQAHTLTFNPAGLELGDYAATIIISSNDPEIPELDVPVNFTVIEPATVEVIIMVPELTFPFDISENGEYVAISGFGSGGGFLWSKTLGLIPIGGDEPYIQAVSEDGVIGGTARNPDYNVSGQNVAMAGYWQRQTGEWTFLPINPEAGAPIYSDYTSTWGMTADGSTIVGMQYFAEYQYRAFKWTEAGGYDMIGDVEPAGNRPNGISNDGSVVYGWANLPAASRSPVIWVGDEYIQIAPDQYGEANAASSTGEYVVGFAGTEAFIWNSQTGTTFFSNTLNDDNISPLAVSDAGNIFGYTVGWPPFPDFRRGFVRMLSGEMMTFNDYALSRGMADAADWTFLSINGVTPDESKFIGSAITPEGQNVSFMIDFGAEIPNIVVAPASLTEALNAGEISIQEMIVQNTGNSALDYQTYINFAQVTQRTEHAKVPAGRKFRNSGMELDKTLTRGGNPSQDLVRNSFILNYDDENVDAIGLTAGGTFYTAARFPAEMVYPFEGATISSVDVYINDLPTNAMLKIWGAGTTTTPGELLHEQAFTPNPYSWNTISLSSALTLDGNDIWIGFTYTHDAGFYIAGIDGGPSNTNGDFISQDGTAWEHLSDYGLGANWNIRAMLQLGEGDWLSLDPTAGTIPAESSQTINVTFDATSLDAGTYTANILITSNDPDTPITVVPVTLDLLVGIDESNQSAVNVYPVPAANYLNVEMPGGIKTISMFNSFGQLVMETKTQEATSKTLNLSGLNAGVYTLRIASDQNNTISRTIIITR
jgi:hypothetical protein